MAEWKTLNTKTIDVGGNNFVEISLKQPPEGEHVFIGISKGWFTEQNQKRYKANILFDKKNKDEIIKAISEIE